MINSENLNLFLSALFVRAHDKIRIAKFTLFRVLRLILVIKRLYDRDSTNGHLSVSNKAATLTFSSEERIRLVVKLGFKVLDAINGALMLTRSTLRSIKVPLYTNPDRISCLGIIQDLTHISNGSDMLETLEAHILIQFVLLRILLLDSNSLT